jgi:NAD(P)-dependent dehydrogenase (short-subunit alcohol dehydrogenase family)
MKMGNTNWPPRAALITGAGSGLGRRLAVQLAAKNVAIGALDINAEGLHALERELGANGATVALEVTDVTDAKAVVCAAQTLESKLGPIDLLIASAGIGVVTPALSWVPETFAAVIHVNLIGVANSAAAVLPGMLARRRGQLVAISSVASFRGLPWMAAYCASKSGVNAMMESIRLEVRSRGVTTTTVCPGWIRTPMTDQLKFPKPQIIEVEDASRRILEAVRKRRRFAAFPRGMSWPLQLLGWLPSGPSDWVVGRIFRLAKLGL